MAVIVSGEIDVATVPELRSRIYAAIDSNPGGVVVIDLAGVTFIDSTGLGVLVGALKKARQDGGEICITQPQPNVWKVLTVTGLHKLFLLEDGSSAKPSS